MQDKASFSKQMQEKFMNDLQNIQLDSDSQLQASSDFYQGLKSKINTQLINMRTSKITNNILQQLKTNINKEMNNVQQYEQEIQQMKNINTQKQNVIAIEKIQQIKNKIASQTQNLSKIILADEEVLLKEKQQQINKQLQQKSASFKKNNTKQNIQINKNNQINSQIQKKIQQANLQRQRINMERQDQLSMKYQNQVLSDFFSQRFLQFKMPKFQHKITPIKINITKPKSTFTNLAPLPNNQNYVLPKNAPQIALKSLGKTKRIQLVPIQKTNIKIQFKKIQNQQIDKITDQISSHDQQKNSSNFLQRFSNLLSPYVSSIISPLKQLQKSCTNYKPKFIKNHLNENQKISNIDISDIQGQQRSLESIIANSQSQNIDTKKFKEFKLTFQNITNVKGIQAYQNIQYAALQHNIIKDIKFIQQCNKLIELNLSHNRIRDLRSLEGLPWLRYLNINYNRVRQISFSGGSLQILHARHNQVQKIIDLNKNKYLRTIDLSENKLHVLQKGIDKLYFLQQLYLSKNYIQKLQGIQYLLMLQNLDLSHNRLFNIPKSIIFMFLNILNLSYNQLKTFPQTFLPSLQKLYLNNNKITGERLNKNILYFPELKQINLDDNEIKGFSTIWFFVRFSKKLQILKYDSNEYFLSVRQKVRQLYEAIIYRNMTNLKILNLNPADSGVKAYYESAYKSYLEKGNKLESLDKQMKGFQAYVQFLLKENKIIMELQNQYSKIRNTRFTQTQIFIKSKSVKRAECLQSLITILSQNINIQKQPQIKKLTQFVLINDNIYYHHDKFQQDLLKKIHKIKSLFYRFKYQKQKRRKYFIKNQSRLLILLKFINEKAIKNGLIKIVKKFSIALKQNKQQEAAIKIQKIWRGYKYRKLFKKLFGKLKNNDDSFQMQQVDLDDFESHQLPEFNFDLPDGIDFEQYIIEPKYFQIAADQAKKRPSKNNNKLEKIEEQKNQQYNPMMNNFMKEQKKKIDKTKKKQDDQKLMKQWGFQNPASLQALRWKKKRKQDMKRKQALQNMTAAQRFQRFKMIHK